MITNGPNLGKMINAATGDNFDSAFRSLLRMLDILVQPAVISKTLTSPPGSPANGDRYIIGASPSGAWSGQAKSVTVWTTDNPASPSGVWEFYTPKTGWVVFNEADTTLYYYSGSAWVGISGGGSSTLAALTDVNLSSPANGQVLTFNSTSGKWENQASTSASLAGDSDVSISSPSNGEILTYDSGLSKWKNAAPSGGGGSAVGANVLVGTYPVSAAGDSTGLSYVLHIKGQKIVNLANTWKAKLTFWTTQATGSVAVAGMRAYKTARMDNHTYPGTGPATISHAAVTIASSGTPSLSVTNGVVTEFWTDAISMALDADHDFWLAVFFSGTQSVAVLGGVSDALTNDVHCLRGGFSFSDCSGISDGSNLPSVSSYGLTSYGWMQVEVVS